MRMRVVPADQLNRGDAARQVLARNPQRLVGLSTDGVNHRVVALGELAGLHMLADHQVAEEPEPWVRRGLLELCTDRLDLRVIGRHTGAHQAPRRRQHLEHVDVDVERLRCIGQLQQ